MKGVAATKVPVPYHDKTDLIAATGQDYIPALDWGGRVVPWTAIPGFLETEVPTPTLFPGGQVGLATIVDDWGHHQLEEKVWRVVVTRVAETFADPRERWVFEEMQTRSRGPWGVLESRRAEFLADLEPELSWIDRTLEGREWLLGSPSLADFGVFGGLSPLRLVGEPLPPRLGRLAAWADRVQALRAAGPANGSSGRHPVTST
jgi:glutathione S-transferase